jgi:hypothetical protein
MQVCILNSEGDSRVTGLYFGVQDNPFFNYSIYCVALLKFINIRSCLFKCRRNQWGGDTFFGNFLSISSYRRVSLFPWLDPSSSILISTDRNGADDMIDDVVITLPSIRFGSIALCNSYQDYVMASEPGKTSVHFWFHYTLTNASNEVA